jgi:phospholipid/cholesterol/gamma-HCH transport system ATP-binding protein
VSSEPPIELRDVFLSFGGKLVLSDISLQVERGSTLALLGVTGAGKSVLLKLVLGLLKPDQGQIRINGTDTAPLSDKELNPFRKNIGMVFQEGALFDSLSVYENVAYPLSEQGVDDDDGIERRVREVLSFVEMEEAIDKMPAELSGGMRRRVSIARAIVNQPSIMLYDSPTAGLDPVTAQTIDILIAKLRDTQGVTSILVTQRLQDAIILEDSIYSAENKALVPASNDGKRGLRPGMQFIVLKDAAIYFRGSWRELCHTQDPYLLRYIS